MNRQRNLFLAITIPDDLIPGEDDPDAIADEIVRLLNDQRIRAVAARAILDGSYDVDGGAFVERILVNAIPAPQWLTPETLRNLRTAADNPEDV